MPTLHPRQGTMHQAELPRIIGMQADARLFDMTGQARRPAGACHGVPVIPHPARVQYQRIVFIRQQGR